MLSLLKKFTKDRSGATAIEYALIASLFILVIIGALSQTGLDVNALYSGVSGSIVNAITAAGGG